MFSHPVSVTGYCLVAVGFVLVFIAAGMRDGSLAYVIGTALMGVGPFLMLLGVIAQGFLRLERYLSGIPQMRAAFAANDPRTVGVVDNTASGGRDLRDEDHTPIDPAVLQKKLDQLRLK